MIAINGNSMNIKEDFSDGICIVIQICTKIQYFSHIPLGVTLGTPVYWGIHVPVPYVLYIQMKLSVIMVAD